MPGSCSAAGEKGKVIRINSYIVLMKRLLVIGLCLESFAVMASNVADCKIATTTDKASFDDATYEFNVAEVLPYTYEADGPNYMLASIFTFTIENSVSIPDYSEPKGRDGIPVLVNRRARDGL